ncbi:hypothetical protein [Rathayibacter soli]|uniref:hypothetical protein n=1 Tax=Rathayibacter soli TaxID=3144168 RepID=UPI0027E4C7CE|nr:hypothetical protein [Glaciibacter superstes]
MAAQRKYPAELRQRVTRLAVEARKDPATRVGAYGRIGDHGLGADRAAGTRES